MKKYIKYLFLLMFLGSSALFASEKALLKELFSNLDPTIMGNEFQQALTNNNEEELIRITATYFRNRSPRRYFRDYQNSKYNRDIADKAVTGDITVVNFPWQFPDGKIDWFFNPTGKEVPHTNEWMWQLNRMSFWIDMSGLFEDTGDKKYSQAFNDQVYSWVISAGKCGAEWNVPNSSWRTIETGIRLMHAWPYSFEVFRTSEDFTDKNICLMLGSMYQQAVHLQKHYTKQNWLLMEMSGLYTFAALFPEFKQSASMRTFATKIFSKAITEQILPDGMHYELSPDYHSVTLGCAFKFCKIAQAENLSSDLPKELLQLLELSYESSMLMATPHLKSPRTNDCPTVSVPRIMQQALKLFPHRQDFKWFATNRKEGHPPSKTSISSYFMPWAGFAVMRSDWGDDATYCCFDIGPLGMGHFHQDKLNINIFKGGEELIYDDGGGLYDTSIYRIYGPSAAAHNTILVDGLVQMRDAQRVSKTAIDAAWISNEKIDYARGTYDDEWGIFTFDLKAENSLSKIAAHTREVLFIKPDFFCVQDTLKSLDGKNHSYEMRLQLDTIKVRKVDSIPGAYISDYNRTYDILIVPLFTDDLNSKLLSKIDTPPMAGWFVGRNDNNVHPSTTLTMTVSDRQDCRFATLLIPLHRNEVLPEITKQNENIFQIKFRGKLYSIDLRNLADK